MSFANNIKTIRKENNLSQEQLAEKLGVSRQSVSKWESSQSYPEMDKILLICKLFDCDIGELMNDNIKEVSETKQAKTKVNKVIEDFFDYITRLVDMFMAMTFKQKLKCLFEQAVIATVLLILSLTVRYLTVKIICKLFGFLSYGALDIIRSVFDSVIIVACIAVSAAVLLHIFKIRYLDYYEIVKTETSENSREADTQASGEPENTEASEEPQSKKKTLFSKKHEKIVIRDPKHSGSKFLVSIMNAVVFMFKLLLAVVGIFLAFSFVFIAACLVADFLIVKSGALFIGVFMILSAMLAVNFLTLRLIYNFIESRKSRKNVTALILIISLAFAGIGAGLTFIGTTQFSISDDYDTAQTDFIIPMEEDLTVDSYHPVTYVESDREDIKITVTHARLHDAFINYGNGNSVYVWANTDTKVFEQFRAIIGDINNKQLRSYYFDNSVKDVTVYASKENIQKLMENSENFNFNMSTLDELRKEIEGLEYDIILLEDQLAEKDMTIEQFETHISEKDIIIQGLNDQITALYEQTAAPAE